MPDEDKSKIKTAVVIVHGMGSQRPVDTLDGFVKTALRPLAGEKWLYYSRPALITESYEARRYIAFTTKGDPPVQQHTELYEYHWSYLMTGNRFSDVVPSTLRLMLRWPKAVPAPLYGAWRLIWLAAIVVALIVGVVLAVECIWGIPWPAWLTALVTSAIVIGALRWLGRRIVGAVTASFVDVVRYLDTSPRSYEARRNIRGGLVDLLGELHQKYDRIVVAAHSLGGYIAYDALTSVWAELHAKNAGPTGQAGPVGLEALDALQEQAAKLLTPLREQQAASAGQPSDRPAASVGDVNQTSNALLTGSLPPDDEAVRTYQELQFKVWLDLRRQGNPWRVTDFITFGTPMYLADLLVTQTKLFDGFGKPNGRFASRAAFGAMLRRGQLVRCPPRHESAVVEAQSEPRKPTFGWVHNGREVLSSQSLFAVVRWTNFWFPVERGSLKGDWFGGPLRPLFGPGIRDVPVNGNEPDRLARAMAHTMYFSFPKDASTNGIAHLAREAFALTEHTAELAELKTHPQAGAS